MLSGGLYNKLCSANNQGTSIFSISSSPNAQYNTEFILYSFMFMLFDVGLKMFEGGCLGRIFAPVILIKLCVLCTLLLKYKYPQYSVLYII